MKLVSLTTPSGKEALQVESHDRSLAVAVAILSAGVFLPVRPGVAVLFRGPV